MRNVKENQRKERKLTGLKGRSCIKKHNRGNRKKKTEREKHDKDIIRKEKLKKS